MIFERNKEAEIKEIVKRLGDQPMVENSHGFEKYGTIKIIDAAEKQAKEFLYNEDKNAALTLMGVVLAANRNYNKQVQPHLERMKNEYPALTFKELQSMLLQKDYVEFGDIWGHKDKKKYDTLKALVGKILAANNPSTALDDFKIMKKWAENSDLENRKKDSLGIGNIPNIGIATFQHIRMSFGIDTVKPDQQVKEVLSKEFEMKLSSEKSILAIEEIARITGHKVIVIDQIFVKYGSGYYARLNVKH